MHKRKSLGRELIIVSILGVVAGLLGYWVWYGLVSGEVRGTKGGVYTLEADLLSYTVILGLRFVLAVMASWKLLMRIEDLINPSANSEQ